MIKIDCKNCSDNNNGWCKVVNSNKKEDKELKCKYNAKYTVMKLNGIFYEIIAKDVALYKANVFKECNPEFKIFMEIV